MGPHGVNVADRVHGRDSAEIEWVVDDRHEEVRSADHGLIVVDSIHRSIVACIEADQQAGVLVLKRNPLKDL
jgi:hypothetical protein